MVMVNGRMSEQSFKALALAARAPRRRCSASFDLCLAQSALDAERFSQLGVPTVRGDRQSEARRAGACRSIKAKLAAMQQAAGDRQVFVAASTHPGEEDAIIEAHRRLRHARPRLLTIIVPRHPERGTEVLQHGGGAPGCAPALRSHGVNCRTAAPTFTSLIRSANSGCSIGWRRWCSWAARWSSTAGRIRSKRPSSARRSCTARMCGISAKSMPRSMHARGAEEVENIEPSGEAHRRFVAGLTRSAQPSAKHGFAHRGAARRRARPHHDASSSPISCNCAWISRTSAVRCVSRLSGGRSPALAWPVSAAGADLRRASRAWRHETPGRSAGVPGDLHRQFHAGRHWQDADRDRSRQAPARAMARNRSSCHAAMAARLDGPVRVDPAIHRAARCRRRAASARAHGARDRARDRVAGAALRAIRRRERHRDG